MTSVPAATDDRRAPGTVGQDDEEMPRLGLTGRRALLFGLFVASALAFLYFVLPRLAGLKETWHRLNQGDPWWLGVALLFEAVSFFGYVWLFRTVFVRGESRIDWTASYEISMAGVAATRLFAAAGAGGIALTAWAVRRSGMEPRVVACRMVAFLCLLYIVYALALVVDGLGLRIGLFPGPAPFGFTVVPAAFGGVAIICAALVCLLPHDVERRLDRWAHRGGRFARLMSKAVTAPALAASGLRTALKIIRDREVGVLGAFLWWGFDIATLWACFHAFGEAPPWAVIVMAYYVGMLANTLPLPGGIGGVDGGMIGTFIAFDVNAGLAVIAVLVYRGFAFWLPTVPGAVAYFQLRRRVAGWRTAPATAQAEARA
jgi:uncharacterized membrane protein YbhN (UPF0104 family)